MLRSALRRVVPVPVRVALTQWPRMVSLLRLPAPERGRREDFPHLQCARATPLRRETAAYGASLQRAKEQNVTLAARALDGVVIRGSFSWHRTLGPPVGWRGYAEGPELHDDVLEPGAGGGLCQAANLLYWLALHAGLEVVERHRHALDLFPDEGRSVPFGCGATVFFPHKDLKLASPARPALVCMRVEGGALHGELRYAQDPGFTCEVVERDARLTREGGVTWRENALWRTFSTGQEELIARHRAKVTYPVA